MKIFFRILLLFSLFSEAFSQEVLAPLHSNINLGYYKYYSPVKNELSKTAAVDDTISLPFFEDFYYAPESPYPTSRYWIDSSVYVNTGFAIAPPSIGVATFDGLNKYGYPYNISAAPNVSAPADSLTSKPVNLHTKGTFTYTSTDSIAFSFFYQSAGFGENPEQNDSLVLEFYKPLMPVYTGTNLTGYGRWVQAWGTRGVNNPQPMDSTFKKAFVYVTDTAYLHEGFRFRFRNKATTSGSLDHWHIDYIYIDKLRSKISDSTNAIYNDVAFAYVPRPFLKNYSAMPYKQYKGPEMAANFSNFIRYNSYDSLPHYNEYRYAVYDPAGSAVWQRDQGQQNIYPFKKKGYQNSPIHSNPLIDTLFPSMTSPTTFKIKHIIKPGDTWAYNDTVVQYQVFDDYFSHDDGSAELGYYLNNAQGGKIALRYTLNVQDTLQALDVFFDPVIEGNVIQNGNLTSFRICVWANGGGMPGAQLLLDSILIPKYLQFGYNKIPRYALTSPLILSPGTYYIGIRQTTVQHLNIGFDKNVNHKSALFYNISGLWTPSGVDGSLMMHPIFGGSTAVVGIKEESPKESVFKLYPNPAADVVYLKMLSENEDYSGNVEIYSSLGEKIKELRAEEITQISTSDMASGLYFVILRQKNSAVSQQKLIISR